MNHHVTSPQGSPKKSQKKSQAEQGLALLQRLKKRAKKLEQDRTAWDALLEESNRYITPYRTNTSARKGGASKGDALVDHVFDATAPKAGFRFAGMIAQVVLPDNFFGLELGPVMELALDDGDEVKQRNEQLEKVAKIANAALQTGAFDTAKHEMGADLFNGTGALLLLEGNEDLGEDIVDPLCVPISEVTPEYDGRGRLRGAVWPRLIAADELLEEWPDGTFSGDVRKLMKDEPEKQLLVYQYTRREKKAWKHTVWCDMDDDLQPEIHAESFRASPWIFPRWFVVPGENFGRGPALLGLPFVKVLNKVQELALMAGALAVQPIWLVKDDQTFNPDTARQEPGAFWTVRHTGGRAGQSIVPLPIPQNFDISSFIIQEQRAQVKEALFDDPTFSESSSVRSPTEIADRRATHNKDIGGVFGRLKMELIKPIVQRTIDILEKKGMLKTNIKIDQLLYKIKITSPLAEDMAAAEVKATVDWLSIVQQLGGPEAMMMAGKMEKILPGLGRKMGVPESDINGPKEIEAIQKLVVQFIAQQQMAAQQAQGGDQGGAPEGGDVPPEAGIPVG